MVNPADSYKREITIARGNRVFSTFDLIHVCSFQLYSYLSSEWGTNYIDELHRFSVKTIGDILSCDTELPEELTFTGDDEVLSVSIDDLSFFLKPLH